MQKIRIKVVAIIVVLILVVAIVLIIPIVVIIMTRLLLEPRVFLKARVSNPSRAFRIYSWMIFQDVSPGFEVKLIVENPKALSCFPCMPVCSLRSAAPTDPWTSHRWSPPSLLMFPKLAWSPYDPGYERTGV